MKNSTLLCNKISIVNSAATYHNLNMCQSLLEAVGLKSKTCKGELVPLNSSELILNSDAIMKNTVILCLF